MVPRPFVIVMMVSVLLALVLVGCSAGSSQFLTGPAGTPTPTLPAMEATVDALVLRLSETMPVQVQAVLRGRLADGCVSVDRIASQREGDTFRIMVLTKRTAEAGCGSTPPTFEDVVSLDVNGLAAGLYTVQAGGASGRFQLGADNVAGSAGGTPASQPPATPTFKVVTDAFPGTLAAEQAARALLAQALKVASDKVEVTRVETTQWPDGCLGLPEANESCASQVTPGFRVTLKAQDKTYVYRTDGVGLAARPDGDATTAAGQADCSNRMSFVRDVTVPDNAAIAPGDSFVKTWRLQNAGTCTWTRDYALVFDSGDALGGPESTPLAEKVAPKGVVDVSVQLVAPLAKGKYQGLWKLRAPNGETFAVAETKRPFWVKIEVTDDATPTPIPIGSTIRGRIWHDLCRPPEQTAGTPAPAPFGCIRKLDGTYIADGVYKEGEPPIGGPEVTLGKGPCPSEGLGTALAGNDGVYTFKELVAGAYCVSIDPLSDYNLPILVPGAWTYPLDGKGMQTVNVDGNNDVGDVDFAWDYQFAP